MFNRKKDLIQQHITLKEIFKQHYSDLSSNERNDVRQAIFDLEEVICDRYRLCNNIYNPYKYIFANASSSIVSEKMLEIIDKLTVSNGDLLITKTRACGVTNILVTFVMWTCLNEKPKDRDTIWVVTPNWNMSEEFNTKLRIKLSNVGNKPSICNKNEIEFNGWRIYFMATGGAPNNMVGRAKPFMVIMDEASFDVEGKDKFNNRFLECYPDVRVIETLTRKNDEINRYTGNFYGSQNKTKDITTVNVQWFHDLRKCNGLRFERTLNGIENTININEDDIPTVIGNDDYLYKMFDEGWRLNSDWLENWDKMQPKEYLNEDKSIEPVSKSEIISVINKAVTELCEIADFKPYTSNTYAGIVEFFKNCKTIEDVENMKKKLMVLINPAGKKKENINGYVNLLKDVFEL